jgi:heme oxygenase
MSVNPSETSPVLNTYLQRLEQSLEELDTQIARLSIAAGLPLDHKENFLEALREIHQPSAPTPSEHRHQQLHDELRGLLVLRYEVITKYAHELGPQTTRELLIDAESHLQAIGFKPGADGINLDSLFGPM